MSRNGRFLVLIALATLGLAGCAPASVEEDVTALQQRVDTLEKQFQAVQQAGGSNAALEKAAQVSITAVNQLVAQGKIDEAKAKLKTDTPKYARTKVGRSFQSLSAELAVVGKDCPSDWGIEKWFQGQDAIELGSDATTVVVFWESWCPHCRREVPNLQATYERYRSDGLQLIGVTRVNKTATEKAVQDLITQNNVSYPMAKENGSLAQYFNVSGIPAAAVIKDGKVVWRGHPARITDGMIQGWLAS